MSDMNVSLLIKVVDQATAPIKRLGRQLEGLSRNSGLDRISVQAANTGRALGNVTRQAAAFAARATALTGAAGFAFKKLFIDTAAQFEKYQAMLRSLEGSNEAAARSMDWVSQFANTVPYELDDMMKAFVRLRTFGLDPTDGTLQALVDQTAKMGGSAADMQGIILAVGQAWTKSKLQGEEALQLIERGVPVWDLLARRMGITAAQVQELSRKGRLGREAIRALVEEMGRSSKGAAAEQAKTWSGMISMISDQWTRFANKVMANGVFDWLKGKLGAFLEMLNALAASGRMDEIARQVGVNIVEALKTLWQVLQAIWSMMQAVGSGLRWLHDLFGSWKPVVAALVAIMAGPLLLSLVTATQAVYGLGAALMATPVGWILGAVAAIAGAVYLIYKNWDSITEWFTGKFNAVKKAFKGGFLQGVVKLIQEFNPFTLLLESLNGLIKAVTGFDLAAMLREKIQGLADMLPGWIKSRLGLSMSAAAPARTLDPGAGRAEVGGLIRVEVTGDGRPQVREATASGGVQMEAETYSVWGVAP
ncbi:MAG: hypothetical protein D6717_02330 [Gammaproteobacteria bacterium]|nr:MAG: hypothetical protein D6717_02330 [Gammaproteobacteria bacterium]